MTRNVRTVAYTVRTFRVISLEHGTLFFPPVFLFFSLVSIDSMRFVVLSLGPFGAILSVVDRSFILKEGKKQKGYAESELENLRTELKRRDQDPFGKELIDKMMNAQRERDQAEKIITSAHCLNVSAGIGTLGSLCALIRRRGIAVLLFWIAGVIPPLIYFDACLGCSPFLFAGILACYIQPASTQGAEKLSGQSHVSATK